MNTQSMQVAVTATGMLGASISKRDMGQWLLWPVSPSSSPSPLFDRNSPQPERKSRSPEKRQEGPL